MRMRFCSKTGKYVDTPQPSLGPVEKALQSAGSSLSGDSASFPIAAVAEIGAVGIDRVIDLAGKIESIFKKGK